jgi:hypothetical protein
VAINHIRSRKMSHAADWYLGDWLPRKKTCRCDECEVERVINSALDQKAALKLVLPYLIEEHQVLERSYLPEPNDEESAGLERIALLINVVSKALEKTDGVSL